MVTTYVAMARMNPDMRMPRAIRTTWLCDNATVRLFARLSETRIMFKRPPFVPHGLRIHLAVARRKRRPQAADRAAGIHQAPAEALPDSCTRAARRFEPRMRR